MQDPTRFSTVFAGLAGLHMALQAGRARAAADAHIAAQRRAESRARLSRAQSNRRDSDALLAAAIREYLDA